MRRESFEERLRRNYLSGVTRMCCGLCTVAGMSAPIPVGHALVTIVMSCIGDLQPMVVTFGAEPDGIPNTDIAAGVRNALLTAGITPSAAYSNGYTYDRVECDFMTVDGLIHSEADISGNGAGTTGSIPSNCALLVTKRTALGGRKNRGRMYWPPSALGTTAVDRNGNIAAPNLTTIRGRYTAFLTALTNEGVLMKILHGDGSTPTLVTALEVSGKIATQRRRLR